MSRDLPSLNAIRVFEAAAQHLNFTRAAESLHITQGAVSRQIMLLERELGRQLFVREGPRLRLTDTGREYSRIIQQALEIVRQGTARLRQSDAQTRVRMSVLPAFAVRWLVHRLASLHNQYPDISLWLTSSYDPVDFNRTAEIDVGIRLGKGDWPGVYAEPIARERLSPVCSPALAVHLREPSDILKYTILSAGLPHDEWSSWFQAAGLAPPVVAPTMSRDYSVLLEAATQGVGIVLARDLLIADALQRGQLVRPFNVSVESTVQYHFVCLERRLQEPAIATLLQWFKTTAQDTVRLLG